MKTLLETMGELEIPLLCYNFLKLGTFNVELD